MNTIRNFWWIWVVMLITFAQNVFAGAETGPSGGGSGGGSFEKLDNPLKGKGIDTIQKLLAELLKIVVQVGLVVVMFFIIYAGFLYVTAAGDESKITKAHETFKNTMIGAIILLGAQVLASILDNTIKQIIGK